MATITRVQHVQYDDVLLLAVEGAGTTEFWSSNMPKNIKRGFGAVFTGTLRVTKSSRSEGYFFLLTDRKPGSAGRRTFFKGTAKVRVGGAVITVADYYDMLVTAEAVDMLHKYLGV